MEVTDNSATIARLTRERDEALAECTEQARLLGMSGEREVGLRAEVERLRVEKEYAEEEAARCVDRIAALLNENERMKLQLIVAHNFPIHPGSHRANDAHNQADPASYRQGWIDAVLAALGDMAAAIDAAREGE